MKRPQLVHFFAIISTEYLHIQAFITSERVEKPRYKLDNLKRTFPIRAFRQLRSCRFSLIIEGLSNESRMIFRQNFDSDTFGNFSIQMLHIDQDLKALKVYETESRPGIELFLGTFFPVRLKNPKKIIISDMDKTLVDTKYHNIKDILKSLFHPISSFPTIEKSLSIFKSNIDQGFIPFILSASPHFYEYSIRDWLSLHRIFNAGIYLKDFRQFYSLLHGVLTFKDIKAQGLYKLSSLIDILQMTGMPYELILLGDDYESDPLIYSLLSTIIHNHLEPWVVLEKITNEKTFKLGRRQAAYLLTRLHQLYELLDHKNIKITIYIRKAKSRIEDHPLSFTTSEHKKIIYY